MPIDLVALVPLEPPWRALDALIGACLCEGGIWRSPATSDGIQGVARVLVREAGALRLCGRLYEIDQTVHPFWLELERDASGDQVLWRLYFDVVASSPRQARNAVDSADDPEDVSWRARLAGEARVAEGALALVAGATRVIAHD